MSNKIYPAMARVMAKVSAIDKERRHQQGYQYRGADDIYNHLHVYLSQEGVFCTSEVIEHKEDLRQGSKSLATVVTAVIKFTFHADDGSSVSTTVLSEGMDFSDKAAAKAMTMGHKTALIQAFLIPTQEMARMEEDDTRVDSSVITPEQAAMVEELVNQTDSDLMKLLHFAGAEEIKTIPATKFDAVVGLLQKKLERKQA